HILPLHPFPTRRSSDLIDLAVGVIIGAAFGKIIESLVKNIIMPVINLLIPGEQSYVGWKLIVGTKEIPYGLFLGEVVNFLIIARSEEHTSELQSPDHLV